MLATLCLLFYTAPLASAGPQSTTYEIKEYQFGSGGISGDTSTTYSLFGASGETSTNTLNSSTYSLDGGLTFMLKAQVPPAPTLSTPASNYDRIKFVINTGGNPTDTVFAIGISTDNFVSDNKYVKSDGTVGTSLASTDFKTYTNWGGATGTFVTGLLNNTTYYIRVKARDGSYTESEWGPAASIITSTPSLTFSLDSNSITFNNLNAGNSYTDSSKTSTLTTTTNGYGGFIIYGKVNRPLTTPDNNTIANYASPNTAPTSWTGTGFGYTTNDNNLSGGTANRFNNSANYAGFTTSSSTAGDPVADDPGPVTTTQISNEAFTISYRITANNTTPAGTYTNVIQYTISPTY